MQRLDLNSSKTGVGNPLVLGRLLCRWDVENPKAPKGHLLMNKVNIELNMLHAVMMNRIGGEVDGGDVVAIHTSQRNSYSS